VVWACKSYLVLFSFSLLVYGEIDSNLLVFHWSTKSQRIGEGFRCTQNLQGNLKKKKKQPRTWWQQYLLDWPGFDLPVEMSDFPW
jgi:hypothetical protein